MVSCLPGVDDDGYNEGERITGTMSRSSGPSNESVAEMHFESYSDDGSDTLFDKQRQCERDGERESEGVTRKAQVSQEKEERAGAITVRRSDFESGTNWK